MKKIGIVVDNFKLEKFKEELISNGYTDMNIFPFTEGTTTIKVNVQDSKITDIARICKRLELHFKRSN